MLPFVIYDSFGFFLFYFTGKIPKTDLVDNTFGYKKRDYPNKWDNLFSIW